MDLRKHFEKIENKIIHIKKLVDSDLEIPCILQRLEDNKILSPVIFEKVKSHRKDESFCRVVSNVFADRSQLAILLRSNIRDVARSYVDMTSARIKPTFVDDAYVLENKSAGEDVDLYSLPIVKHHEKDVAPYITSGMVIVKDPETGTINGAIQRLQLKEKNKLGLFMVPTGHNWKIYEKYSRLGKNMPVAIVIGHHPNFFLGMQYKGHIDENEYEVVGGLFGEPLRITKGWTQPILDIPADAELVLEGEVPADYTELEGPMGEYTHYYCQQRQSNVVNVTSILYRNSPIFLDIFACHRDHHLMEGLAMEGQLNSVVRSKFNCVKDIYLPPSGCCQFYCYISIEKNVSNQPFDIGHVILSAQEYIKYVIVVDHDINVFDEEEVLWAIATRSKLRSGTRFIDNLQGSLLDPTGDGENGPERAVLDATLSLSKSFPERIGLPQDMLESIDLDELGVEL